MAHRFYQKGAGLTALFIVLLLVSSLLLLVNTGGVARRGEQENLLNSVESLLLASKVYYEKTCTKGAVPNSVLNTFSNSNVSKVAAVIASGGVDFVQINLEFYADVDKEVGYRLIHELGGEWVGDELVIKSSLSSKFNSLGIRIRQEKEFDNAPIC